MDQKTIWRPQNLPKAPNHEFEGKSFSMVLSFPSLEQWVKWMVFKIFPSSCCFPSTTLSRCQDNDKYIGSGLSLCIPVLLVFSLSKTGSGSHLGVFFVIIGYNQFLYSSLTSVPHLIFKFQISFSHIISPITFLIAFILMLSSLFQSHPPMPSQPLFFPCSSLFLSYLKFFKHFGVFIYFPY